MKLLHAGWRTRVVQCIVDLSFGTVMPKGQQKVSPGRFAYRSMPGNDACTCFSASNTPSYASIRTPKTPLSHGSYVDH